MACITLPTELHTPGILSPCWVEVVSSSRFTGDPQGLRARAALVKHPRGSTITMMETISEDIEVSNFTNSHDRNASTIVACVHEPNLPISPLNPLNPHKLPAWNPESNSTAHPPSYIPPVRRRISIPIASPEVVSWVETTARRHRCPSRPTAFTEKLERAYSASGIKEAKEKSGLRACKPGVEPNSDIEVADELEDRVEHPQIVTGGPSVEPGPNELATLEDTRGDVDVQNYTKSVFLTSFGFTIGATFTFSYNRSK